jgi:hypothetical protein
MKESFRGRNATPRGPTAYVITESMPSSSGWTWLYTRVNTAEVLSVVMKEVWKNLDGWLG